MSPNQILRMPVLESGAARDGLTGTPWQNIAESIPPGATHQEILKLAGLDWKVVKAQNQCLVPVELPNGDTGFEHVPVKDSFALVRTSDNTVLSPFTGNRYKPVQNADAFEAFHTFAETGDMTIETAGSLSEGRYVWALASLGDGYMLGEELIKGYFLLVQSHLYGNSLRAMFTPIRYPGGHTMIKPLRGKTGAIADGVYRMPHSRVFDEARQHEIMDVLGAANRELDQFMNDARFLSSVKLPEKHAVRLFMHTFDPAMVKKTKDRGEKLPQTLQELQDSEAKRPAREVAGWTEAYAGHDLDTCDGTAWGAFQTIVHAIDHAQGKGVDTRMESSWFGINAKKKAEAFRMVRVLAEMS